MIKNRLEDIKKKKNVRPVIIWQFTGVAFVTKMLATTDYNS